MNVTAQQILIDFVCNRCDDDCDEFFEVPLCDILETGVPICANGYDMEYTNITIKKD